MRTVSFNSLRQIVYNSIQLLKFDKYTTEENHINKIICGAILYKYLKQLIAIDTDTLSELKNISDSLAGTYKNIAESLKNKYVSYKRLYSLVRNYRLPSFLAITEL